ncbi:PEPxxWA-CTERM sorting domain-containing protein [Phenylobacterium sp. SCN 70-31]|uniref:PEPxxWA-CTERM sorting domain-containing protein n=1 Tax=Phenylobacterium sp. SCN 70-31 TaxID=1660129 RepID=UPI00086DBFCE|nr:PEPxxWA-CTERM sorting domain-containing protein [Phenylobacterium sp. SCN 70-31]ODT87789.1 MAG: hypothetical protein ABS78_10525 [Phenylobacterium sp. SCN 70-31]
MAVAAAKLATPVSYALIRTTVCEALPEPMPPGPFRPPLAVPVSPGDGEWPPGFGMPPRPLPIPEPEDIWPGAPPPVGPPVEPPAPPPVTAVPEPGTWAMMILGFGVLGVRLRRRRATAS